MHRLTGQGTHSDGFRHDGSQGLSVRAFYCSTLKKDSKKESRIPEYSA